MPFQSHFLSVSIFPHVFSKLDPIARERQKGRYKSIKTTVISSSIGAVGALDAKELINDALRSQMKAYAYKSLFAIALGPVMQFVSLPMYIFSYGTKFRSMAVSVSELGSLIMRAEAGVANWVWLGADLLLFGEPVPITDSNSFKILFNETDNGFIELIKTAGGSNV